MNSYVIFTDSACDIKQEILAEWGIRNIELSFRFEGEDKEYLNSDMDISEFYSRMKEGGIAKTAAINPDTFEKEFESVLSQGSDVLYLAFSSGLSTTCNSAKIAAEELSSKYPERTILVVDTLSASAGQGMLVYLASAKQKQGASVAECAEYLDEIKGSICHWFTVDDLVYLKRGGRVSPAVALIGKALGIKPVMHVDDEGKLVKMGTARGRHASITALCDKYTELAKTKESGLVYISHADCLSDAQKLANMIEEKHGVKTEIITDVGTVIGAHAGPGTLALFFVGTNR